MSYTPRIPPTYYRRIHENKNATLRFLSSRQCRYSYHRTMAPSPDPEKLGFTNGSKHGLADTTNLFSSLKVNVSRDNGHEPQHDVAPNSRTQNERARTALALSQRNDGLVTPPQTSRPTTPYTLSPPVDFDGLSWPSMSSLVVYRLFRHAHRK